MSKLPNRALVYGVVGGYPMIFDADGRGKEIYPTGFVHLYSTYFIELLYRRSLRSGAKFLCISAYF